MKNFTMFNNLATRDAGRGLTNATRHTASFTPDIASETDRKRLVNDSITARVWKYVAMLLMVLTLGMGEMWGMTFGASTIYFDNTDASFTNPCLYIWSGGYNETWQMSKVSDSDCYWTYTRGSNFDGDGFLFKDKNTWTGQSSNITDSYDSGWWTNCYSKELGWKIVGPKNMSKSNTTTTEAGSGTSESKYIVKAGTKITVSASGTKIDANHTVEYKFNDGSWSTTNTYTVVNSAAAATDYSVTVYVRTKRGDLTSREFNLGTFYYRGETKYNVKATVSPAAGGTATPTSNTAMGQYTGGTITASNNTGYHFTGWTGGTGTYTDASATSTTFKPTAASTVTANFAINTYTVTYNANDAQYPGTATGSTSSSSHIYGTAKALTSNGFARTGYMFAGWATSPTGDVVYTNGQSVTNLTSTHGATVTLYAKWTAITVSASVSPSTGATGATQNFTFSISSNVSTSDGYYVAVYNFGSVGSGTHNAGYINGDKAYTANPTSYTTSGTGGFASSGNYTTNAVLIKEGVIVATSAAITYSAGDYYSVSFNMNGHGSAIASQNIPSGGTATTPSPAPTATGYTFGGWYEEAGCITAYNFSTTITANKTLYAKWTAKQTTVTLNRQSGTGGSTSVTATYDAAMPSATMPTRDGYAFQGYYGSTGGSGTKYYNANGSSAHVWDQEDATKTIYAHWAEPKYDVTVSISNPAAAAGDIACTAAGWVAGKSGTAQIGNATAVRLTVGASNAGYKWGRWVLTGGVTLVSGSLTDPSIEVKATATGTATYTYDEELETSWYIAGDAPGSTAGSPFSGWGTSGTRMYKKTGHSTEEIYYCTISVSTVATTDAHFPFKVYNQATDKYYQDNGGSGYWILKDANTVTLKNENDKPNMKFRPYIAGDYEFKVDNTGANPVLTVTWPVINQLRISAASPTDATNTNNFDLADQGSNNWSVSRTLNAKTTYTFKIVYDGAWYGKNSTALTRASASASGLSTSGGDMTITTDAAGSYTFTFNSSTKNLSVTYPAAYTVTFGKGTGGNTIGASATSAGGSFTSGDYVASGDVVTFSQTPATGYTFKGWYTTAAGSTSAGVDGSNRLTINAAKTVYAQYTPNDYTITLDKNTGSANGSVTATYNSTATKSFTAVTKTGYVCTGYWTATSGGYKVVNADGTLASYSSNISAYLNSSRQWIKTSTPTTLYAQWRPATYTITLDKNGGTSNGTATATYDSNKLTSITAPTKTGYHTVDGYYKEGGTTNKISDLSGNLQASTTYTNASSQWSSTSNQTLYAKWAANTYTIAFNANDANYVGEATGTTASIAATYGVSYTLTANGFSRAGYTFNGWNTNADGTSGTNYSNSQTGVSNLTATNGATVTLYAKWTGLTYTVSFNKGAGTCAVSSTTVTFGSPYSAGTGLSGSLPEVTPPSGSVFNGWYDAPTGGNKIDDETLVTTVGDHTLYARFTQRDRVYFYNNLGWSDVYVTYDPRDWSDEYGTGNQGKIYHHMTQIAGTDVWYDDLPEAVLSDWKWFVAFNSTACGTVGESGTYNWFNSGDAVYRHDFDSYATMFVPESAKTDNWGKNTKASPTTTYYSSSWTYDAAGGGHGENYRQNVGYWMRYNDEKSGYSITGTWDGWANSTSLRAAEQGATTFAVTKVLDANTTYEFLLYKEFTHNTYNHIFTNTTTMTSANCTNIEFTTTNAKYSTLETNHAKITTTVAGEYVFKLTTGTDGTLKMSVEYPMSTNDYRVLYTWNDGSSHTHASEIIKGAASTEKTISVFVHKASDVTSRSLKIQQCTGISGVGVPTWTDRNTIDLTSVSESGVHNFIITQPATGYATGAYSEKYTGNYYIRTESADGGWDYYLNHTDNVMTRSDYSMTQTLSAPFSHYYCRYIESTSIDITYQIATDYSPCVSEVLVGDATIGGVGNTRLPAPANVRFSWNEQTNALRRAYLKSAQGDGNTRYLVMHGADNKVRNDDATGTTIAANPGQSLAANELLFADQGNWVYQVSLKVVPGAKVSLIANYNSADRYLVGGADSYETIVGGTGENLYGITAVYDFKTNRLLTAWTPSGDITEALTDVDLLLLRHGQDGATTITFGVGGSLSAQRVTGAIRFDYDEMFGHVANWTADSRPLLKYFISFPFDVNVSDVFGLNSPYGDAYIIQRYAGDERAAKGFFRGDGTTTFWEDMPHDGVMKANVGYCVILDNDYFNGNETGAIWQNKSAGSSVYLYFPSAGDVGGITETSKTITVPAQTCTIDRTYTNSGGKTLSHTITDSHWNMMGVPIFNTHRGEATSGTPGAIFVSPENDAINFRYFYSWNSANNKFSITSAVGYDFKSMHSYMVQYTGNVTFTGGTTPSSVAARRMPLEKKYTIDLQALDSNDEMINRTYVELREQACDTFALSEDVYMESNNLAINIYTYAGNYDVAANVLSVGNHVVPVGLDVRKTGTYSLSMPSEFSGSVYLIDQETGERTNLAIGDVTIDLEKGTYDERFLLEINVDEEIVTDVEYTTGEGSLKDGKPHKFLQNGILYLLRDGVVYDAQGHLIK